MNVWDGIKRQFRSVIAWESPQADTLFYKWSDNGDEIKNASTLIVGPGQGAIFVYEGRVVSITTQEGITSLLTDNIPFWTTIKKFMQAFESEHKVGIYFFRMTFLLDQKWGTTSPIKYEDPKYSFPINLQAYGNFSYQIKNPEFFFTHVVGASDIYTTSSFHSMITSRIVHPMSDYLAEAKIAYIDIDAKRDEIALDMQSRLNSEFETLGFELVDFRIEGTNFDAETLTRISRIADTIADTHAAEQAGISYKELQQLQAMRDAANNESGAAGVFMGMGAGSSLAQNMNSASSHSQEIDIETKLRQLKKFFEEALINEEEYQSKKAELLRLM
jgi:membrane protease subunit (stomatin/prohibitin family)